MELRAIIKKIQNAIIYLQIYNNNVNGCIIALEDQLNNELPCIIEDNLVQLGIPEDFAPSLSKFSNALDQKLTNFNNSTSL